MYAKAYWDFHRQVRYKKDLQMDLRTVCIPFVAITLNLVMHVG